MSPVPPLAQRASPGGSPLPEGWTARTATADDLDRAHALVAEDHLDQFGEVDYSHDDMVEEWSELDPARDAWLVFDPAGTLVGYAKLNPRKPHWLECTSTVHPAHRHQGVEAWLVDRIGQHARELLPRSPPGERVQLAHIFNGRNEQEARLLESRGYAFVRRFFRMGVEWKTPPPTREPPPGVVLRVFQPDREAAALHALHELSFADHWRHTPEPFEQWSAELRSERFDPTLWFVAEAGGQLVGFARAREFSESEGWVRVLGVHPRWRRRGLAQSLLLRAFGELHRRGRHKVLLGVDSDGRSGALQLYERVGMRPVRLIDVYEKDLGLPGPSQGQPGET
ncbi:GNAT family N-acetyltransferase [Corallococcus sp. CA049B]|uniref:GNAT family N-acetyltransferase n=1 Tax=Corallococcus sp. CA049B TaxID=2316730 RepID=UPI000EA06113|nr:GNAT family N-acetyltransferase [Corallococcus sp. CA049B]RKG90855.1 GNAT family N-acetyltransferase [Corallococcus sp. CA049B]